MEQISDDELDHGAEEDSDKEDQDLDKMFGAWLGELDKLTQSLDDGRPQKALQKPPLRQETNIANFSYRFSMYNINEALNQGDSVDLDALMADLCSIEQELTTISKPNSAARSHSRGQQRAPGGRSASTKHTGGGGSSGGSTSSSTRASPANTVRGGSARPVASNLSLDDITSQLEKASLSMDEAARQTSSSSSSSSSVSSATLRRPSSGSCGGGQHRRTGSVGMVSEQDAPSQRSSMNSACASASSMDSLDTEKVMGGDAVDQSSTTKQGQNQTSSEHATMRRANGKTARRQLDFTSREGEMDRATHSYLDRETSLILKSIAGKPSHLLTKEEQAAKLKAEKIRVALEKIKEAQVKKLVIRVHMSDESSKTMMVDERQTVRQVLDSLLDKSHCGYSPDWSLVETINELQMERIFEDHENLVENLLNWTRDSHNKLMFIERIEKYALFKNPQNYLLGRKETSEMLKKEIEASAKVISFVSTRYICLICGWKTKIKGFAISHVVRSHNVECPFRCTECPQSFFLPSQLQHHVRLFHRPGRYACPFCSFRSEYIGGFRRHCSRCSVREEVGEGAEGGEETVAKEARESRKRRSTEMMMIDDIKEEEDD